MSEADRERTNQETVPESSLGRIRRLRGVTWEWRSDAPIDRSGREGGVIAQDVQAVRPDLVERVPEGHLRVDYFGLIEELADGILELGERMEGIDAETDDDDHAGDDDPVAVALTNLRAGRMRPIDHTALVGTLVEAVKELDRRLTEIEDRGAQVG